jgi:hypothetical protein
MNKLSTVVHDRVVRYVVNGQFSQAILFFADGSYMQFEHTSRDNRWTKASSTESLAGSASLALEQFRLNAKHLQLYFSDGSNAEFFADHPLEPPAQT